MGFQKSNQVCLPFITACLYIFTQQLTLRQFSQHKQYMCIFLQMLKNTYILVLELVVLATFIQVVFITPQCLKLRHTLHFTTSAGYFLII